MAAITTVITGATSGIGKETAIALAKKKHALYLLVRDVAKGEMLVKQLTVETGNHEIYVVYCNLTDLQSVYKAAETLKSKLFAINVLINNAGGIFAEFGLSTDGYELTFAANHLGHFVLTNALLPLLERGQARVINVSSEGHKIGRPAFDELHGIKKYSSMHAYANAKLYNIFFTKSLAEKFGGKGITSFALHPGVVKSNFWDGISWKGVTGFMKLLMTLVRPFMISAEKGALTTIYLATQNGLHTKSGQYFNKCRVAKTSAMANDVAAREALWNLSQKAYDKLLSVTLVKQAEK
ncbi:SDR family oxidoreductase [Mucilaginibacter gynuensis]|uniref:SDR family oxidoreductase n=1 Tax=Mucilaginibacter gynuensis TaxID=1302236 RepID=A0ABP8FQV3_9SPHI